MDSFNSVPITAITKSLCMAMNINPPKYAKESVAMLDEFVREKTDAKGVDRVVIYNPDAIGEWIARKYSGLIPELMGAELTVPMLSVFPPKTPVCFGSMYTGARPDEHGITHYEKKQIAIDSYFDALVRAGKRVTIVSVKAQSMDILYRGRDIDYYSVKNDREAVDKGIELIHENAHDVIIIYNQEYDDMLHRTHSKSFFAKRALKHYNDSYRRIKIAVNESYVGRKTLVGALTDHGSHRSKYILGTHGANIPKDMNILHFYDII